METETVRALPYDDAYTHFAKIRDKRDREEGEGSWCRDHQMQAEMIWAVVDFVADNLEIVPVEPAPVIDVDAIMALVVEYGVSREDAGYYTQPEKSNAATKRADERLAEIRARLEGAR